MKRSRVKLGELCSLTKGASPISKTTPGPYPLVTTGEVHKTSASYQFDCEAVCVPTISSTGHGHASLKRVHYQAGKFAVGNLLVAAVVKDPSTLSTRYLAHYLMHSKDRLIVPLMTGVANMSISLERLASVPVEFPTLAEQERIVEVLDELEDIIQLRSLADNRADSLPSALYAKMFLGPERDASHWPRRKVKEVVALTNGRAFKPAEWGEAGLPIIRIQNLRNSGGPFNYFDGAYDEKHYTKPGDLLISWAGQLVSFGVHIWDGPVGLLNQHIFRAIPLIDCEPLYLKYALGEVVEAAKAHFHGIEMKHLTKGTLEEATVAVPPLSLQREFAERLVALGTIEKVRASSGEQLRRLVDATQYRAFVESAAPSHVPASARSDLEGAMPT